MTTAWFHCFSGVAGDMALGELIDAGAPVEGVRELLRQVPVGGWELEVEPVLRGGIAGTKVHVHAHEGTVVRTAAHIQGLVAEARLPERVQQRAAAVFSALANAEGRLHRRPPDQVHFHEVGGLDAIVDVVGTCAALELLDIDQVQTSPVSVGLGMVRAAHGIIPNPAPAVVELLAGIPTRGVDLNVELTTPTGAALIAALSSGYGAMPAMTLGASGFGAGSRELPDRPNLTQVVIGEVQEQHGDGGQPVVVLSANIDDSTGELLAHAVDVLMDAGAHDAWITPIVMKKGRPAHTISVLADPALASSLGSLLAAETGTLGVRVHRIERWVSPRTMQRVEVDGRSIRVKVSPGRVKPEFEDAARLAAQTGRPVREVLAEAAQRWNESGSESRGGLHIAGVADLGDVAEPVDDRWVGTSGHHRHDDHHSHDGHQHGDHQHDHGTGFSHDHPDGNEPA